MESTMAPRASWKGYIKLSLVSCPVRLYPAVSANEKIRFNQLHKDTHNRINMKPVDPELGLVERADLVRGYEYEDRYESALMEMIKEKLKGHKPIIAAAPERGNVINLMDALKASLGQAKPAAPSKSKTDPAPAAKKAPAKPSLKEAVAASKAASAKAPAKKKAS
jgi:non-homologous end joining protein Ku